MDYVQQAHRGVNKLHGENNSLLVGALEVVQRVRDWRSILIKGEKINFMTGLIIFGVCEAPSGVRIPSAVRRCVRDALGQLILCCVSI